MADLQARIGPAVFSHRTWIRPGYHPPKTSHKHGRQNDGSEQEALHVFGPAGHPRDPSFGSEKSEESGHSDLGTIPTRRGRSNPDHLLYSTHSLGRSLSSSSSLLQRMGISAKSQKPPNAAVDIVSIAEKRLIERMDTQLDLAAETGGSDTPSRVGVSEHSPKAHESPRRHIENPQSLANPDTTSLSLERTSPNTDSQKSGSPAAFTTRSHNGSSYSNDPRDRASPVPATFCVLGKEPLNNANQQADGSENHEHSNVAIGYQAASPTDGDHHPAGFAEIADCRDSLTPFSAIDDDMTDTNRHFNLQHQTPQFPLLNGDPSHSASPPTEQIADNILLPLAQKNAFERSKYTPPETYDDSVSLNPDVITREEISSFADRIPAINEELRTLRYTPSPDGRAWSGSPAEAQNPSQTSFVSSILRIEQGHTRHFNTLPSREPESLNHAKPRRYLPRRSSREKVASHISDHTQRKRIRTKRSSHRSWSPSQILHSLPDETHHEARRSRSPTHSDGPLLPQSRPSSSERHHIRRYNNRLSKSPSRGRAPFKQSHTDTFRRMSPSSSKEQSRNGFKHRNYSHRWREPSDDYPITESARKYPPLVSQENAFVSALASAADDDLDVDMDLDLDSIPLPALHRESEPRHSFLPCHNIPGLWLAQQGLDDIGISTVAFEIDSMTATTWKVPPKVREETDITSKKDSKLALLLCCFDRAGFETTMQTLGSSVTSEDLVGALLNTQTVWPPEGHLIISVNAEEQEGSTYLPHTIMSSLFLRIESNVHMGTNSINLIQLSDMSDFMFVLLAQEHLDPPKWKLDSDVDQAALQETSAILKESTP